MRELIVHIGIYKKWNLENLSQWQKDYFNQSAVRIENGIPLVEFKEQEGFVASNVAILVRAYAYRNEGGNALIIYNDDKMVGLVFCWEWEECYILDQLMIDYKYQEKGYSKTTLQLVIDSMKKERKYNRMELCYCKGNEAALSLFKGFGFYHTYTEEEDDDEIVMALDL